jgi:hypothetical protein
MIIEGSCAIMGKALLVVVLMLLIGYFRGAGND